MHSCLNDENEHVQCLPINFIYSEQLLKNTLITLTPGSFPVQPGSRSTATAGIKGVVQGHRSGVDEGGADVAFLLLPRQLYFYSELKRHLSG